MTDYWLYRWRVVFDRRNGHETHTVDTIAEIRKLKQERLRDPDTIRERHWRIQEWIGPVPPHVCRGVSGWTNTSTSTCACGTDHRRFKCGTCGIDETLPPRSEGCGPLANPPPDPYRWAG